MLKCCMDWSILRIFFASHLLFHRDAPILIQIRRIDNKQYFFIAQLVAQPAHNLPHLWSVYLKNQKTTPKENRETKTRFCKKSWRTKREIKVERENRKKREGSKINKRRFSEKNQLNYRETPHMKGMIVRKSKEPKQNDKRTEWQKKRKKMPQERLCAFL